MSDFIVGETQKIRRERIATAAMQAMIGTSNGPCFTGLQGAEEVLAQSAIKAADALIAELDKK